MKWKAFEDEVVKNNILNFELYPTMNSYGQFRDYGEYNELVILEMNLTKIYDEAIAELKEFLHQCDRTVKYRIACKTRKTKDPFKWETYCRENDWRRHWLSRKVYGIPQGNSCEIAGAKRGSILNYINIFIIYK